MSTERGIYDKVEDADGDLLDYTYPDIQINNGEKRKLSFESSTKSGGDDGDDDVLPAITITSVDDLSKNVEKDGGLIYKITDPVPIHLNIFFALQQALLSLSTSLAVSLLVAQVVCAEDNEDFKAKLLSSTLFMNGITTLLMVTLGIRLPLYQGATPDYVAPLLAMAELDKDRCNNTRLISVFNNSTNMTELVFPEGTDEIILQAVQGLQGSLLAAGAIHLLIGATGLVGVLLRFIGPVTIVPTILLIGIYMVKSITKFAQFHWGISLMTCAIAIILSLYLGKREMPIPVYTRKKQCHVIRYPLHQVFAILIALAVGWLLCGILTAAGVFSTDRASKDYYSRTDARTDVISRASWFYFPYPGQFGKIGFNISAFVGFFVATIVSILDSIGDYYACAATCNVPPPPAQGVNRGIAIEGFCSALSGAVGCGHATTTYGGNIGAIGLTRVGSRWVFITVALIYIVFGVIGKVSAVFITIPYPVLGGVLIVMFGVFNGVVLSNLKSVDLSSTRNLAIIGTSLLVGLMIPHWVEEYDNVIDTGNKEADDIITMILGNPNLAGGVLACFLDNTIPGTREERGIAAWETPDDTSASATTGSDYSEGYEVYNPIFYDRYKNSKILRFLPFMPNPLHHGSKERSLSHDFGRRRSLSGSAILSSTR
ncbi:solute carrier family 23 member 1-like isoform X2 [Mizuhopecten yessoensis]|uniref:Solute carrier family 23 member 2 n=1 Tax=Mizuhopecten yessoensis TaxID=6573 RepID=A0A210Q2C7_MIZYE|nr:solute carrier family 23 member 1-like isoform X2 [Mizuhopecten yessoensis]OWF42908.1 Solute carrier family 23 member 2 [Mizuhopecten yessoensis]